MDLWVPVVAYDSLRRRHVVPTLAVDGDGNPITGCGWQPDRLEDLGADTKAPTWYVRDTVAFPNLVSDPAMAFDSQRGVMVLFGAGPYGTDQTETWEYKVTNSAMARDAPPHGVDLCLRFLRGRRVLRKCGLFRDLPVVRRGRPRGTCTAVTGGTEVTGSCPGQACASSGSCSAKNGTACSSASACASGYCVDGVCCESKCDGTCVSCNQTGRPGKCSAYAAAAIHRTNAFSASALATRPATARAIATFPKPERFAGPTVRL